MNENLGLCSLRYNAVIDLSLGILWKYCFLWRRLRWIILVGWKDAQGGTWMVRRMRLQPSIQATSSLRSMYSGTVLDQLNCQACRSYSEKSRGRKKGKTTGYSPRIPLDGSFSSFTSSTTMVWFWCQSRSWSRCKIWQDWGQSHFSGLFRRECDPSRWKHDQICTNTVRRTR